MSFLRNNVNYTCAGNADQYARFIIVLVDQKYFHIKTAEIFFLQILTII